MGGKSGRYDGHRMRRVVKIEPYGRTEPKAMGHVIWKGDILIEGKSGPQPCKGMEPITREANDKVSHVFFKASQMWVSINVTLLLLSEESNENEGSGL